MLTFGDSVVKELCTVMAGLPMCGDTGGPTVGVLLSEPVVTGDAVNCEAGIPPSRSLKYSESLREELSPSRSSTLLFTSAHGQS